MGRGGNSATLDFEAPIAREGLGFSRHEFNELLAEARAMRGGFVFTEEIGDGRIGLCGAVLHPMEDGGDTLLVVGDGPDSSGYLLPPLAQLSRPGTTTLWCTEEVDGQQVPVIGLLEADEQTTRLSVGAERMVIATPIWKLALGDWPMHRLSEKTGRNEPCPCGSGRKFKRCCGS